MLAPNTVTWNNVERKRYKYIHLQLCVLWISKRLEWAGHVVRMSYDRTVIKIFLEKPDGRRKAGRPKLRCFLYLLLLISTRSLPSGYTTGYLQSCLYRVSQEECARLRESVPYVHLYRYNPKHLYPKFNGYGDNGQRSLKL